MGRDDAPQVEILAVSLPMTCYYLSPRGDDAADGRSSNTAWRSLSRASQGEFAEGDHLLLEAGQDFAGSLILGSGGAMTIGSFGDGRARILAGDGPAIKIENRTVVIENIEAVGGWNSDLQSGSDSSGVVVRCHLPNDAKPYQVGLRNLEATGFRNSGISIEGGGPGESRSGFDGVHIQGCVAHGNGAAGISMHGNWLNRRPGWCHLHVTVVDCVAHHNRGRKGLESHTGSGIVLSDLQYGTIERCLSFENGENNDYVGGGPVGIWCWDCDSVTIRHCEAHSNRSKTKDGGGFDLDGGCTNCVLEYNVSHDNAGCGYLVCQYNEARPFHHNTVRFNKSTNDGRHNGGGVVIYDDFDGISDCQVYGNHFSCTGDQTGHEVPSPLRILTPSKSVAVFENLFESGEGIPIAEIVDGQEGLVLRDNRFVSRGQLTLTWHGRTVTDVDEMVRLLGGSNIVSQG